MAVFPKCIWKPNNGSFVPTTWSINAVRTLRVNPRYLSFTLFPLSIKYPTDTMSIIPPDSSP